MIIRTNNNNYLIGPAEIKKLLGIETENCVVIDKTTNKFGIKEHTEEITSIAWEEEDVDGRKFRKIKKDIIEEFGNKLLDSYKSENTIQNILSKKFINTSGVSEVFRNALSNNMNLILFGKGGFGKSEMCGELFGRPELKSRVFIKSLSEATTEEDLFGGINIKKMTDTGVIEYNCENSFANSEIVIFEEIFDANPRVLAALKDTLTSKEIRNGNQRFPMKTKIIIGLTNKTYDEVIQDDSTEALTQRFPIAYKLEYNLTKLDIASLILNRYNNYDSKKLAAILETTQFMKNNTPRKVLEVAKYIKDITVRKNRNYSEQITNNSIEGVMEYLKHKTNVDIVSLLLKEIVKASREIKNEEIKDYDQMMDIFRNSEILKHSKIDNNPIDKKVDGEIDLLFTLINKAA